MPETPPSWHALLKVPVIGPPGVLTRAKVEADRLMKWSRWAPAFVGATPAAPLLVARLDQPGVYYYIVSFHAADGVTARVRINAHTGAYAEAIGVDKSGDVLVRYVSPERFRQRLATLARASVLERRSLKKSAEKRASGLRGTGVAITFEPFPIWRPCLQSLSAFLPFYKATDIRGEHYCRVDGRLFEELTIGAGH